MGAQTTNMMRFLRPRSRSLCVIKALKKLKASGASQMLKTLSTVQIISTMMMKRKRSWSNVRIPSSTQDRALDRETVSSATVTDWLLTLPKTTPTWKPSTITRRHQSVKTWPPTTSRSNNSKCSMVCSKRVLMRRMTSLLTGNSKSLSIRTKKFLRALVVRLISKTRRVSALAVSLRTRSMLNLLGVMACRSCRISSQRTSESTERASSSLQISM